MCAVPYEAGRPALTGSGSSAASGARPAIGLLLAGHGAHFWVRTSPGCLGGAFWMTASAMLKTTIPAKAETTRAFPSAARYRLCTLSETRMMMISTPTPITA